MNQHRQVIQSGGLLLDVRTSEEYQEVHLEGALNIPVQELPHRLSDVTSRAKDVVVYCRSGRRSDVARSILESAGCNVIDISTMANW
jgi:phage shock protein E